MGIILEIELESSSEYKFEISFLNETDPNNVIDMTEEVIEEADEHHVFMNLLEMEFHMNQCLDDTIRFQWKCSQSGYQMDNNNCNCC